MEAIECSITKHYLRYIKFYLRYIKFYGDGDQAKEQAAR